MTKSNVRNDRLESLVKSYYASKKDHLGTYDKNFETSTKLGDPAKREFTYLVLGGTRFMYASAIRLAVMKFVATMSASADVLALALIDIENILPGSSITIKYKGMFIF